MSRKLFIAGNWKMNTCRTDAVALARAIVAKVGSVDTVDLAVCPPLVYLSAVGEALAGSRIALGAQNMYHEDNGAFTGETSAAMLNDLGVRFVILGHSERRHVMGESDELVGRKVRKALAEGLQVILCVGELLDERKAGKTADVVARQVKAGLAGVSKEAASKLTIAYEPVWAIGTGVTASPEQAQEVHAMIRGLIGEVYDGATADSMRIQYGGSVKPSNAADLLAEEDIDGALVGGASLKAEDFAGIVESA
ncbi:MAG: triose-phosphate isomerase [Planctomycetes bacterium]|nr:triose-phosphate isomerase [Planctomycetota bacterium]